MSTAFKPDETFRDSFTFRNSEAAIRRFPMPFPEDNYMYSVNIEPHTAGPPGSVTEFPIDIDEHYVAECKERALVLAALSSVDLVTAFVAPTPIGLIEAIRPDVLVKGADYTVDTVVGAEVVNAPATSTAPVVLTAAAIVKVKEIMATQDPLPAGLRIGVVGGGCSGFQYSMSFENAAGMMDKVVRFEDLKVFVDATSAMYLNGCTVDYVETLEAAGFKFENPQVKSTCGCGSSFSV